MLLEKNYKNHKSGGINMSNLEKYNQSFIKALSITEDKLEDSLNYQDIPEWDSVGHMSLVAELEDNFLSSIKYLYHNFLKSLSLSDRN